MPSSDESTVSYACPQCGATLAAQTDQAGQYRSCPRCGKQVKVPGGQAGRSSSGTDRDGPAEPTVAGLGHLLVVCPCCGTRLYAQPEQVGQQMVCPDCLESVEVTAPRPTMPPPATQPPAEARDAPPSATPSPPRRKIPRADAARPVDAGSSPAAESDDDGAAGADADEFKLSEPVDLRSGGILPKELADLVSEPDDAANAVPPPANPKRPPKAEPFAVTCPVCDSRIYATDDDIGSKKACPDCYSEVAIEKPRPKPQRVSQVDDSQYAGDAYTLSQPEEVGVFKEQADSIAKKLTADVLEAAEQRVTEQARRDPALPDNPLWTGLFRFLADGRTAARMLSTMLVLLLLVQMAIWAVELAHGGAVEQFAAIFLLILWFGMLLSGGGLIGTTLLAIIEDTSNGQDKITSWPPLNLFEWMFDSLALLMAFFYAAVPGVLLASALSCAGVHAAVGAICVALSVYLLFPVVQLSVLESAALSSPFSSVILASLNQHALAWITFYLISGGMGLASAILAVTLDINLLPIRIVLVVIVSLMLLMYYRLLGRVTWICRNEPTEQEQDREPV